MNKDMLCEVLQLGDAMGIPMFIDRASKENGV